MALDGAIDPVLFYGHNKPNGIGSNFSSHGLTLPNPFSEKLVWYLTGEHRYQAMKAKNFEAHEYVRLSPTPYDAKKRGREIDLVEGWGNSYDDPCWHVMLEVILSKVDQHREAERWLKLTGDRVIYEDSPTDDIWGWRFMEDYRGKNLLGRCWMTVRDY